MSSPSRSSLLVSASLVNLEVKVVRFQLHRVGQQQKNGIPTAMAQQDPNHDSHNGDDQVDHLLGVFLVVLGSVPGKRDSRVGQSGEEEEDGSADAGRQQLCNSIFGGRFEQLSYLALHTCSACNDYAPGISI